MDRFLQQQEDIVQKLISKSLSLINAMLEKALKYCSMVYKMRRYNFKHKLTHMQKTLHLLVSLKRFYGKFFFFICHQQCIFIDSHCEIQALIYRTSQLMAYKWVNTQIHQLCWKRQWNTFNRLLLKRKTVNLL